MFPYFFECSCVLCSSYIINCLFVGLLPCLICSLMNCMLVSFLSRLLVCYGMCVWNMFIYVFFMLVYFFISFFNWLFEKNLHECLNWWYVSVFAYSLACLVARSFISWFHLFADFIFLLILFVKCILFNLFVFVFMYLFIFCLINCLICFPVGMICVCFNICVHHLKSWCVFYFVEIRVCLFLLCMFVYIRMNSLIVQIVWFL